MKFACYEIFVVFAEVFILIISILILKLELTYFGRLKGCGKYKSYTHTGQVMADQMPKVDFDKDKSRLSETQLNYMKYIENQNIERAQKLKKLKRNNIITALTLGAAVVGIYAYSILAVKQETFLDDFNEPAVVQPATEKN